MKKNLWLTGIAALLVCASTTLNAQYVDLTTGKTITIVKNQANGMVYNPETQRVVYMYTNPATRDTFYGRNGAVINGKVMRMSSGKLVYNDDAGYIYDKGDFRLKTESDNYTKTFQHDGDVKLKGDNFKKKIELDGDVKVKDNASKVKTKQDGELKVKDGDLRVKVDEAGNEKVKDSTSKVKQNADGTMKAKDKQTDYKAKVTASGKEKEKEGDTKRKLKNDKEKIKSDEQKTNGAGQSNQ